ncbi:MAG: aminotransferase class V-fold PLP-dependent enzyme [Candidatus Thermoplasmatota archaeon]|nr:aminotransferase class V-fold PLP-dependent enzyme [Candidatus Thermoplasmatota archaeon]
MESTVSFLKKGSRVLIVSNGVFGDRWEKILSRYPVEFRILKANPGSAVSVDQVVAELRTTHYDAVTLTHVETSTGVRIPLKSMVAAVRPFVNLVIVDGVASVGGEKLNMSEWKIDVCLTASQKALGAQAGAGIVVASEHAVSMLKEESISGYLLDLRNWLPIMDEFLKGRGGYFATPPVGTVFSVRSSIDLIRTETIERRVERHKICAEAFRNGIKAMGLEMVAGEGVRSNTVSGVYLKEIDTGRFLQECMANGVEFAAGVHPLIKDRYFRVGHMGWVEPSHIIKAIDTIAKSAISLGAHLNRADGEKAVMETFEGKVPSF